MRGYAYAIFLLLSCAQAPNTIPAAPTNQRAVLDVVRQALEYDAAGLPADSLYQIDATIIRDGAEYNSGRRFAAVGEDGQIQISSMTGDVHDQFAWAYVTYRWLSADGAFIETARASLILLASDTGWRIRHAHSSLMLPWQRDH